MRIIKKIKKSENRNDFFLKQNAVCIADLGQVLEFNNATTNCCINNVRFQLVRPSNARNFDT